MGHCAQNHVVVVAGHRLQLLLAREIFDHLQVRVYPLYAAAHYYVREYRQDLVGVHHRRLRWQAVQLVELTYAALNTLGTSDNDLSPLQAYLEFADGRLRLLQLLQLHDAALVGREIHDG